MVMAWNFDSPLAKYRGAGLWRSHFGVRFVRVAFLVETPPIFARVFPRMAGLLVFILLVRFKA